MAEYAEVLVRPKLAINATDTKNLLALLKMLGEEIEGPFPAVELPDKTDEKFLEVAWAGLADALVTGNGKHFPANRTGLVKVRSPRKFLDNYNNGK